MHFLSRFAAPVLMTVALVPFAISTPLPDDAAHSQSHDGQINNNTVCMFLTSGHGWTGERLNLCETAGQCNRVLPNSLARNVSSAGPSEGQMCFLYTEANCTGTRSSPLVFPGHSNLSDINFVNKAVSWRCWKLCGYNISETTTGQVTSTKGHNIPSEAPPRHNEISISIGPISTSSTAVQTSITSTITEQPHTSTSNASETSVHTIVSTITDGSTQTVTITKTMSELVNPSSTSSSSSSSPSITTTISLPVLSASSSEVNSSSIKTTISLPTSGTSKTSTRSSSSSASSTSTTGSLSSATKPSSSTRHPVTLATTTSTISNTPPLPSVFTHTFVDGSTELTTMSVPLPFSETAKTTSASETSIKGTSATTTKLGGITVSPGNPSTMSVSFWTSTETWTVGSTTETETMTGAVFVDR